MRLGKLILAIIFTFNVFSFQQARAANETYTTSTGAVFTKVNLGHFGEAWKDPSGLSWATMTIGGSDQYFEANNLAISPDKNNIIVDSKATKPCADIGGRLPNVSEFQRLMTYFETEVVTSDGIRGPTDQGYRDIDNMFKFFTAWIWTSSAVENFSDFAYVCGGAYEACQTLERGYAQEIRCVTP